MRRLRPWTRRLLIVVAATLVGLVALLGAAHLWVGAAGAHVYAEVADVAVHSVAIVPGAAVLRDGRPSLPLADRLDCAVALYRAGRVRRVLVSGDHGQRDYDEVNGMRRYLLAHGVPSRDIFMDHAGFRTLDTMSRAARVFEVRDAVICTQRLYASRSVFLARRAGIDAVALIADRHVYASVVRDRVREILAVGLAGFDALVGTEPAHLGPPIPIDGDAEATHDAMTLPARLLR